MALFVAAIATIERTPQNPLAFHEIMKTFAVAAVALAASLGVEAFSTGTLSSQRPSLTAVNGVSVPCCVNPQMPLE